MSDEALRIERRSDGVAVLWFDVPGQRVNTLKAGFEHAFADALDEIQGDREVTAVVLASAKPDSFVVGADVGMLLGIGSSRRAAELSATAQATMDRIEALRVPVVAAIHGPCLGGGLEMALACRGRVATSSDTTALGQPEIKLGVIPGAGGTQRLPRRVGLEQALQLILTGRSVAARRALALGLVDEVVHPDVLLEAAAARARRLAADGEDRSLLERARAAVDPQRLRALLLEDNPAGRKLLFNQTEKRIRSTTGDRLPAPWRALEAIRTGVEEGPEQGFTAERRAFGALAVTREARNLMRVFLSRGGSTSWPGKDEGEARTVAKVGVVGAGLMGAGIATVTVYGARVPVRLKDTERAPLRTALGMVAENLDERRDRGKLSGPDRDRLLNLVRPTTDYSGFRRADVVIEAVPEKLELKRQVLHEVQDIGSDDLIFASNTSTLPIAAIAAESDHPERVIGMHYFSPVPKVPLLEVVMGERTAPWVVATCVALGRRQGKTVMVVRDSTGFYTSRILGPYVNEAVHLLAEGVAVERIDQALVGFGFPVGPLKLMDEVGLDVAGEISHILHDAFGERMAPPPALDELTGGDRRGRKNGRGFYRYERRGGGFDSAGGADQEVYRLLGVSPDNELDDDEVAMRCVLQMVNEAARCTGEGVVLSARDADLGAVMGLGFPPYLGGPLRLADEIGIGAVVQRLESYRSRLGPRFEPAPALVEMAREGRPFHGEEEAQEAAPTPESAEVAP